MGKTDVAFRDAHFWRKPSGTELRTKVPVGVVRGYDRKITQRVWRTAVPLLGATPWVFT